jgi:DNA polymerase I-like protein with 3'-5' exonuclease and polymerase domains
MLIELDAKQLEFVAAMYLSGDKVGREELSSGVDIHASNQGAFALPTRLVAKTFLFRSIYCDEAGGGAYAFSLDPDFSHVSNSKRWWQGKIDAFYTKNSGLAKWHSHLLTQVGLTGRLSMNWGREYIFLRKQNSRGENVWPKTQIYNYPVQGLGAELMAIVRVSLAKRLAAMRLAAPVKLVNTVHDSVLIDTPKENVDKVIETVQNVFKDVPGNFTRLFGLEFDVALNVEIKLGPNWGQMEVVK